MLVYTVPLPFQVILLHLIVNCPVILKLNLKHANLFKLHVVESWLLKFIPAGRARAELRVEAAP